MKTISLQQANIGHVKHRLLPTMRGLAGASLFISELMTSGQIRDVRQGDDPEQKEDEAAAALEAIANAQAMVCTMAEEHLQEYLSCCEQDPAAGST